jgi:hypothetical protein
MYAKDKVQKIFVFYSNVMSKDVISERINH